MSMLPALLGLLLIQAVPSAPAVAQTDLPVRAEVSVTSQLTPEERAKHWKYGIVIYQVFIDRFVPPFDSKAKLKILVAPRHLNAWTVLPKKGTFVKDPGYWTHEYQFWGGDLASLSTKLDYIEGKGENGLGAEALYLMPVNHAFTNHKYDTMNYEEVSPELGTRQELLALAANLHGRKMRIILDGVFNHVGKKSRYFQSALQGPNSPYFNWFEFDPTQLLFPNGYRAWGGVGNLPALKLEVLAVRDYLWNGKDSVVQRYLREGIDGFRLDVGFELGPQYLAEITKAAHNVRPDSVVIAEVLGYPSDWCPAVDGVMNFSALSVVRAMLRGEIRGGRAGAILGNMVADTGIDNMLRSWLLLDNHDTPRLANLLPDRASRHLAQALQMSLPGSPVVYYGSEVAMKGSRDPENRAPMRWDLINSTNPDLQWMRNLISIRKTHPALRYGDFKPLDTESLLAFTRTTGHLRDTVIVVANPTSHRLQETFATRVGRLMSGSELQDLLTGAKIHTVEGLLTVSMPARSIRLLTPVVDADPSSGYSPYQRIP